MKKVEKVAELDEQITRETVIAAEGDEVATACELATVPSRTL